MTYFRHHLSDNHVDVSDVYLIFQLFMLTCQMMIFTLTCHVMQGRSQELEMGGAKLLGEGSGGHVRPPVGPGQSPGRGARGTKPPGSSRVLNI